MRCGVTWCQVGRCETVRSDVLRFPMCCGFEVTNALHVTTRTGRPPHDQLRRQPVRRRLLISQKREK